MSRRIPDEESDDEMDYYRHMLRSQRLRATAGRIALLQELEGSQWPLSVIELKKTLSPKSFAGESLSAASIYRALESLVDAGLVSRINTGTVHASYEILMGNAHHHHIICKKCGDMEDVKDCLLKKTERGVLVKSDKFVSLAGHSLEFFGICKKCSDECGDELG